MKKRVKQLFKIIKDAEAELRQIRDNCKHKKTYEGNWSDRPGSITHANICVACNGFVSATGKMPEGLSQLFDSAWKVSYGPSGVNDITLGPSTDTQVNLNSQFLDNYSAIERMNGIQHEDPS